MKRFETVIRVYNRAGSPVEAAEKAGELFDTSKMENGMTLDCRLDGSDQMAPKGSGQEVEGREYLTVFRILNSGEDAFEAGERAGEIIDIFRAEASTSVSCCPTRCIQDDNKHSERPGSGRAGKKIIRELPALAPAF